MPELKNPHICIQCGATHEGATVGTYRYFCSTECEKVWNDAWDWVNAHSKNSDEGLECPYCGHLHEASEHSDTCYDDNSSEFECEDCKRVFKVETHTVWSWTTTALQDQYNPAIDGKGDDE